MNYYINPIWFYLMQVSTCAHAMFFILAIIFAIISIISTKFISECFDLDSDYDEKLMASRCKKFMIAAIISIVLSSLSPCEETCIRMIVASQVTKENVTNVKEDIIDIIDYIDDKLNDNGDD